MMMVSLSLSPPWPPCPAWPRRPAPAPAAGSRTLPSPTASDLALGGPRAPQTHLPTAMKVMMMIGSPLQGAPLRRSPAPRRCWPDSAIRLSRGATSTPGSGRTWPRTRSWPPWALPRHLVGSQITCCRLATTRSPPISTELEGCTTGQTTDAPVSRCVRVINTL